MIEEIRFVWFGEVTDDLAHSNNLELAPQLSMNFIASFTAVAVSVVVDVAVVSAVEAAQQELSDTEEVECLVSGVGVASAEAAGGGGVMVVVALRMKKSARQSEGTTKEKAQLERGKPL